MAISIPVHSLELVSLVAFSRFLIGASLFWGSARLSYLSIQDWTVRGIDIEEEESDGKWMERIWKKDGKGELCSLIIFPVQPGPLGVEVLLLASGDKPGALIAGNLGLEKCLRRRYLKVWDLPKKLLVPTYKIALLWQSNNVLEVFFFLSRIL